MSKMTRYSTEPRNLIFVKGYGFLFFLSKNMRENMGKNLGKNLIGKCSQKLHDHANKSASYTNVNCISINSWWFNW